MVTMTNVDFVTREITRGSPDTQWWDQLSTAIVTAVFAWSTSLSGCGSYMPVIV